MWPSGKEPDTVPVIITRYQMASGEVRSHPDGHRKTNRPRRPQGTGQSPTWVKWSRSRRDRGAAEAQRRGRGPVTQGLPGWKESGVDVKRMLRAMELGLGATQSDLGCFPEDLSPSCRVEAERPAGGPLRPSVHGVPASGPERGQRNERSGVCRGFWRPDLGDRAGTASMSLGFPAWTLGLSRRQSHVLGGVGAGSLALHHSRAGSRDPTGVAEMAAGH